MDKDHKNESLISLATKSSILCLFWTVSFILNIIANFVLESDSPWFELAYNIIVIADVFTNYLSVILSYHYFHPWYLRLCGCCDKLSRLCWKECIKHNENIQMMTVSDKSEKSSKMETV